MEINQSLPPITCLLPEDTLEQVLLHYRINRNNPRASFMPEHLQKEIDRLRGNTPVREYLLVHAEIEPELKKYL